MGRTKKARKKFYKDYYERDSRVHEIPESTLRYQRIQKEAPEVAVQQEGSSDANSIELPLPSENVIQTGNSNFSAITQSSSHMSTDESFDESNDSAEESLQYICGGSEDIAQECISEDSNQQGSSHELNFQSSSEENNNESTMDSGSEDESTDSSPRVEWFDGPGSGAHDQNLSDIELEASPHMVHCEDNFNLSGYEISAGTDSDNRESTEEFDSDVDSSNSAIRYERCVGQGTEDSDLEDFNSMVHHDSSFNVSGSDLTSGTDSEGGDSTEEFDSDVDGSDSLIWFEECVGTVGVEDRGTMDTDLENLNNMVVNYDDEEITDNLSRLKRNLPGLKEKLNLTVKISVGEILINAISLVTKHNWSHLETEHLMKFAKSILNNGNIFPCSRYLFDEFFFSKSDMCYFFFCSVCTQHLGSVPAKNQRPNQIICPNSDCETVNILSDLSKASYFVTFYLPSQIEVLLSDPNVRSKLVNVSSFSESPSDGIMRDLYHGTVYKEFANYVKNNDYFLNTKILTLTLSVDSAALSQSCSGQSICPCFVMVNELPPVLRTGNLLLAGLWFGATKEKVDLFLPPIVDHIIKLSVNGFTLKFGDEEWLVKVFLLGCCADSVARCDVQGIHSHRGECPCSWCMVEGEEYGNVRIFRYYGPLPPARTIEELHRDSGEALRTKVFVNGVKYMCLLAPAPYFDSVKGFIVDPMHAKDEGTTKAFLRAWLGEFGSKTAFYIGAPNNVDKINSRLKLVKPPKEFRKAVRTLKHLPYWTGRELENWGLYCSIPVLVDILPKKYLRHWALFVQANFILSQRELPIAAIKIAEDLIEKFCSEVETMYCPNMMRFNLHIARHFAANSSRWGPMFAVSAYGFEHGNQKLKKKLHSANYIPNQICRALSEENALNLLKVHCQSRNTNLFAEDIDAKTRRTALNIPEKVRLLHGGKRYIPTEEEEWHLNRMRKISSEFLFFTELVKDGCHFGTDMQNKRTNNCFAQLVDQKVVVIKKIIMHEASKEVWIIASRVRFEPSPYCPPSVVTFNSNLCFQYVVTSVDDDVEFYCVSDLHTICVSFKFDHGHFIAPMPNIFNLY